MHTLTGVVALQQFDRIEAEERNLRKSFGLGNGRSAMDQTPNQGNDGDEDSGDGEGGRPGGRGEWGVRSESDARHSISHGPRRTAPFASTPSTTVDCKPYSVPARQSHPQPLGHLDIDEPDLSRSRRRSGSLSNLRAAGESMRSTRYTSAGGGESTGDWLRDYEIPEGGTRDSEEHSRRVVVVEVSHLY